MTDKNRRPGIQFSGFDSPWEQRKFGDIATLVNGRAYSQDELLDNGKYPVLRVGNFYTNDSWYYSNMELDEKYYANDGDLLYAWSATFGPHVWYGGKVIYHYHIWKILLSNVLNREFAVQLLERDKASILADKNGSTMAHITKAGLERKVFSFPNLAEQKQIGAFFQKLDDTIALHQRKIASVKNIKNSLLAKMFPQPGSDYPELRFEGFTEPWEQCKLGSLVSLTNGDRSSNYPSDDDLVEVGVPFINAGDLNNGLVDWKNCKKITEAKYDSLGGAKLQNRDIVYCLRGTLGKNAVVNGVLKGTIASSLVALRPDGTIDDIFLYYLINSPSEEKQRLINDEGAAQPNLSAKNLSDFVFEIPTDREEQEQIGTFFQQLDDTIALHQQKLEALLKIKEFLSQEMFVQNKC